MEDLNPSEESKGFSDEEIVGLNLLEMDRHEAEGYPVCPSCKSDESLMDITSIEQLEINEKETK